MRPDLCKFLVRSDVTTFATLSMFPLFLGSVIQHFTIGLDWPDILDFVFCFCLFVCLFVCLGFFCTACFIEYIDPEEQPHTGLQSYGVTWIPLNQRRFEFSVNSTWDFFHISYEPDWYDTVYGFYIDIDLGADSEGKYLGLTYIQVIPIYLSMHR